MKTATEPVILPNGWVRPWYPAGLVGHIYPTCPDLLLWESDPAEGAGWLDPSGQNVCQICRRAHAHEHANKTTAGSAR